MPVSPTSLHFPQICKIIIFSSLWTSLASSLWFLILLLAIPRLRAQSPDLSPRGLDALLQSCAFRAFVRPRTGVPYPGRSPSNLTGIQVSGMRLRSGSLRSRGIKEYQEFSIPSGVVEQPYVERLVLVYHNLGNWSSLYYPLPGYSYLAPVLGLLAYDASDLCATDVPELDIRASEDPIRIRFRNVRSPPAGSGSGSGPKCVYFGLHGSVEFDNVGQGNVCFTTKQGHFSIAVEFSAPSPNADGETPTITSGAGGSGRKKREVWKVWAIVAGSAVGGVVVVLLLGVMVVCVKRCRRRRRIKGMERAAERCGPLQTRVVGSWRMPMAAGMRTRPILENEYVP